MIAAINHMVIWGYYPSIEGGAERQCRKLVTEFSRKGHECVVLTAFVDKKSAQVEYVTGEAKIIRLGRYAWLGERARGYCSFLKRLPFLGSRKITALQFWLALPFVLLARYSFMSALKRYLQDNSEFINVLHVHEAHWIAGAVSMAAEGLNLPIVCKEATYPAAPELSYDTPFRSRLNECRKSLHYIAINEAIESSLLQNGIKPDKISLIPNGVDLPIERAEVVSSKSFVYIGNFTQSVEQKAFDILFLAWVEVCKLHADLTLIVLGGGDTSQWQHFLRKNNCIETVSFEGAVADVGAYLKNARGFILPSRIEGLSNALLEAMSWGLPVVISDIDSHRALVKDEQNGLVVPVNNYHALANAIVRLACDESLSLQLCRNARKTIEEKYQIATIADALLQLYKALEK